MQDYTYMKFASVGAGPKDVMLVLDIGGDNYHVLQGKDIDKVLTNEAISNILNTVLEPQFVKKITERELQRQLIRSTASC